MEKKIEETSNDSCWNDPDFLNRYLNIIQDNLTLQGIEVTYEEIKFIAVYKLAIEIAANGSQKLAQMIYYWQE